MDEKEEAGRDRAGQAARRLKELGYEAFQATGWNGTPCVTVLPVVADGIANELEIYRAQEPKSRRYRIVWLPVTQVNGLPESRYAALDFEVPAGWKPVAVPEVSRTDVRVVLEEEQPAGLTAEERTRIEDEMTRRAKEQYGPALDRLEEL